jgi:uncharacterized protein
MHKRTYNEVGMVQYEWDPQKAKTNFEKHEILFADAVTVFEDVLCLTIPDDYPGEDRFITLGMDANGRILVIVYTYRKERIRIISARNATSTEMKQYKGNIE